MQRNRKRLRFQSIALAVAVVVGTSSCASRATREQLVWCSENQGKVGRVALERGLLSPGTDYTEWKQSNPDAYDEACLEAFKRQ